MAVNIGAAFEVLYSPRKALESVKEGASMKDGIILFVLFTLLGAVIGGVLSYAAVGSMMTENGVTLGMGTWVAALVMEVVVGVVFFLIIGFIIAKVAGAIGNKTANPDKTIGLLGYVQIIPFVIGLIASLLMAAMGTSILTTSSFTGAVTTTLSFMLVVFILALLEFIWTLLVAGMAVSVANDVSWGAGIAAYFIGGLIVAAILFAIVFAIAAAFGLAFLSSGMVGAGLV